MEHESRVVGFATGVFLLGGYMALFDIWENTLLMLGVSCLLLLMVAFRERTLQRSDLLAFGLAGATAVFFAEFLDNGTYIPLAALLVFGLSAFNARTEAFMPALAGMLSLEFLDAAWLMKGFSTLLSLTAPIFGLRFGLNDAGYLVLHHTQIHTPIFMDEYKVLLPFYASLIVAGAVQAALMGLDRRSVTRALPVAVVPVVFTIAGAGIFLMKPATSAFILDNLRALALPLACVLIFAAAMPEGRLRSFQAGRMSLAAIPLMALFFAAGLAMTTPVVENTDPVVIIDEAHSEWEPTWPDYLETYKADPVSGVNNYHGMLSILSSLYDTSLIVDRPDKVPAVKGVGTKVVDHITLEDLEELAGGRKAVLILKCVTTPYTPEEVQTFLDFTSKGNGLILISEHTDIYGQGTNLNPISERLGYRFLSTGVQDIYTDTRGSVTQRGELPALISRYMTGDLLWETGCSLEKVPADEGTSTLFEVFTRPSFYAHYRNETSPFFLTREFTEEVKLNSGFSKHMALAGLKYGDGRVVLYTDSTDFNNGIVGFGDHAQIFVAMIEYVAAEEVFNKSLLPLLMGVLALGAVVLNRRRASGTVIVLGILLMAAIAFSHPLALETASFPELKTEPKMTLVEAGPGYMQDYLDGMVDMEKLMDKYFRVNQTAVVVPQTTDEWVGVSTGVDSLEKALLGIDPP